MRYQWATAKNEPPERSRNKKANVVVVGMFRCLGIYHVGKAIGLPVFWPSYNVRSLIAMLPPALGL